MRCLHLLVLTLFGLAAPFANASDDHPDTPAEVTGSRIKAIATPVAGRLENPADVDVLGLSLTPGRPYRVEVQPFGAGRITARLLGTDRTTVLTAAESPSPGALAALSPAITTTGLHFLAVSTASESPPCEYYARLLLPLPSVRMATAHASGQATATLTIDGLPGRLTSFQSYVIYDTGAFTPPAHEEGAAGGMTFQMDSPFPGLMVVKGQPVTPAGGPSPATTSEMGEMTMPTSLPPETSTGGRMSPVANRIAAGTDVFWVLAPQPDTGVLRLFEAFDAGGALLPRIPDLPPDEGRLAARVRLDGRLSRDFHYPPRLTTYAWSVLSAPAAVELSDPTSSTPAFVPSTPGEYVFGLMVDNGLLTSMRSKVSVIVNRVGETPTAVPRAGPAGSLTSSTAAAAAVTLPADGTPVDLDGTLSWSPVPGRTAGLSYRWLQVDGPSVTLAPSATASQARFSPPTAAVYAFTLSVRDRAGSVSPPVRLDVLALPAGDRAPKVSVVATSASTTATGGASDLVPAGVTSLRVTLPASVTLSMAVDDPDVGAGSQTLRYVFRQTGGPWVQLSRDVEEGAVLRSQSSFIPQQPGVHTFECRVHEVRSGALTGILVRRAIRVVVDSATNAVPVARARTARVAKSDLPAALGEVPVVTVPAGTTLFFDGHASRDEGPGAAPGLRFGWRQISGPQVVLSNPFSAVTTFVVPSPPGSTPQDMLFELLVDDGQVRSEPAQVQVRVVPGSFLRQGLRLRGGLNSIGLIVAPPAPGPGYTLADLMADAGAIAAVRLERTEAGGRFRTYLAGAADAARILVEGNRGYLLLVPRATPTRTVELAGLAWAPATLQTVFYPGLNLVHLPLGAPLGFSAADLVGPGAASFAVTWGATGDAEGRARLHLPGETSPQLEDGDAVLLHFPGDTAVGVRLPAP